MLFEKQRIKVGKLDYFKMHNSISKTLFVLGADEYLKDSKAKLENAFSFMSKHSKITV